MALGTELQFKVKLVVSVSIDKAGASNSMCVVSCRGFDCGPSDLILWAADLPLWTSDFDCGPQI